MSRELFLRPALEVAPLLLNARITLTAGGEGAAADGDRAATAHAPVTLRVTEVEAYHGVGTPGPHDPGSHSRSGPTARNASMFGPPGHAYVYLSYGLHFALNLVCSPTGAASGVLIRAGEVVAGEAIARARRAGKRSPGAGAGPADTTAPATPIPARQLARGPGNVGAALGLTRARHDGADLFRAPFALELPSPGARPRVASGPRVGVSGRAGGADFPWRFWIPGDPTVSAYRAGRDVPRV